MLISKPRENEMRETMLQSIFGVIDEENLTNERNTAIEDFRENLPERELSYLNDVVEDTEENKKSDLYSPCIICLNLFPNEVMNKHVHTDPETVPRCHSTICFNCKNDMSDLLSENCPLCRRPARLENSDYVANVSYRMSKIYDGSSLPLPFCTLLMAIAFTYYSNKWHDTSALKWVKVEFLYLIRDAWWFLFVASVHFVYQTRKSVSLLFDGRGIRLILLPLIVWLFESLSKLQVTPILIEIDVLTFATEIFKSFNL
jgi:hypothetical protein